MLGIGLKVAIVVIMIVQLLAIGYAMHLVRRTKYSVIWILCIAGFAISFGQHLYLICSKGGVDIRHFLISDVVVSLCIVIAVLFANRLVNYIDRLMLQRSLTNKRILSAVLRAEERSRSQFAKELHDGMGPLLSSAKMSLSAISGEGLSAEQQEILQNTRFLINEAISSVREISSNMSPQVLMDFGLAQGVQNFISRISALHTVDIKFATNLSKERFDNDIEVVTYRVICELINNSLKHSKCTTITITLILDGTTLSLDYADNGQGFNPDKVLSNGMGLSNITSRIDSLNGYISIISSENNGMKAVARIETKHNENSTTKK
uniref:sensor histidine kinase n=1 Tax=Alistipes sp. TaxID=1872444 RepID=UPI004056FDCF